MCVLNIHRVHRERKRKRKNVCYIHRVHRERKKRGKMCVTYIEYIEIEKKEEKCVLHT